jgi:hypothetical protein
MQPSRPTTAIYDRRQPARRATEVSAAPQRPSLKAPPQPPVPVALPPRVLHSVLNDLGRALPSPQAAPHWLFSDYETLQTTNGAVAPRQPLIPDNRARGVLSSTLATVREGEQLDVDDLIRRVVQGRMPRRLPRRVSATLCMGCQLLLDFADTMTPWWEDLHALSAQVTAVVGEASVAAFDFDGNPETASRWRDDDEREPWRPMTGTPVVVATDFGIRDKSASRPIEPAWHEFIAKCESAGSPLVILIPWPRAYWPEHLGPYPDLVHWNPRTTVAMVRRELGVGHGARR